MEQGSPHGAAAIVRARHLCLEMRGVQKVGTETVTTSFLGTLKTDQVAAERFLSLAGY
jgi:GTP cyclohydrolase I